MKAVTAERSERSKHSEPGATRSITAATKGHRFQRALRSELRNVRATPTVRILLAGSIAMATASCLAGLAAAPDGEAGTAGTLQAVMHSSTVATLVFATIAGAVSATGDFRFGRIDQLLLDDPGRTATGMAKITVGLLTGFGYGLGGAVAAVLTTWSYGRISDISIDLASDVIIRPIVGVVLAAPLFGTVGVAVGWMVRNQPAAIAGMLAWLFVVEPTALVGLPDVGRWLPGAAGLALTSSPDPNLLDQVPGGGSLIAWSLLAVVLGILRLQRSDV